MAEVSVILPTYNREPLLKRAVESVLCQEGADFELIVVDDGSQDETPRLLDQYSDRKELRVIAQEHRGVSAARNRGVNESDSPFIAFIDSDDEWLPGKLGAQIQFSKNTDFLIHQTLESWVRKGMRVNPPRHSLKSAGNLFERSLERCVITPSSVFLSRSLFDEAGGFDESFPACEDYDLWLRITLRYPVGLIEKEYLIRYGGHIDQLSASSGLDRHRIRALDNLLESGRCALRQREKTLEILSRKLKVYSQGCHKRGRAEEVIWCDSLKRKWELAAI